MLPSTTIRVKVARREELGDAASMESAPHSGAMSAAAVVAIAGLADAPANTALGAHSAASVIKAAAVEAPAGPKLGHSTASAKSGNAAGPSQATATEPNATAPIAVCGRGPIANSKAPTASRVAAAPRPVSAAQKVARETKRAGRRFRPSTKTAFSLTTAHRATARAPIGAAA
jgi:hypothetical protein